MDSTHLHLTLTHFPIIGTIIGTFVLAYGIYTKNHLLSKAGMVIFIGTALIAIPAFLTGEEAGEAIKTLPGVSESMKESHEELAEKAIWVIELMGILSLGGLIIAVRFAEKFKTASIVILIVSLVTIGFMVKVGNTGGQIRHSEIRSTENP